MKPLVFVLPLFSLAMSVGLVLADRQVDGTSPNRFGPGGYTLERPTISYGGLLPVPPDSDTGMIIGQRVIGCVTNGTYSLEAGFFECTEDCNNNGIDDACDITCAGMCNVQGCGQSADCNGNNVPDECELTDNDCNGNSVPDDCEVGNCGERGLASHYICGLSCSFSPTFDAPGLLGFAAPTAVPENPDDPCWMKRRQFRWYAGRRCPGTCKIWRITEACVQQQFDGDLLRPYSVLVDVNDYWPGSCPASRPIIVGGDGAITFIDPITGAQCESFPDGSFGQIGQMAIASTGRLYAGTESGNCVQMISKGVVEPIFCCVGGGSPKALCLDAQGNLYVTCAGDGVMRYLTPDGDPIISSFASGLQGACSQAIAPAGIFHGNIFVACGPPANKVVEVNRVTGQTSIFLCDVPVNGIAFDPAGYMHLSIPSEDRIIRIGPNLPGDVNGSGVVDLGDVSGFAKALVTAPDAPLPVVAADMNGDGCANGKDIALFVSSLTE